MGRDGKSHGSTLEIGLLGPLTVTRDGVRRDLPSSRKTRGLLAYLALTTRVCRREDLCDLLWDGAADPRGELRWSLAKIRAAVGPWLQVSPQGVALRGNLSIDAVIFRDLARQATCERSIASALETWRGPPLADVDVQGQQRFHAWLAAERDSLAALRTALLKAAVDHAWAHPEAALAAARRLVAVEPWNEWGHARVAQLLERCGRSAEATDYRARTLRSLTLELGISAGKLLKTPPPPAQRARPGARRPVVRIEPLKLVMPGDDVVRLATQIINSLGAELWRNRACEMLDDEGLPGALAGGGLDAQYVVRGMLVQWRGTPHVSLRCVDLRLGTIIWFGQVELHRPFTRGVTQWITGAVEAIGAAIRTAELDTVDPDSVRGRLVQARALAGALEPDANRRALQLLNEVLAQDADEPDALALTAWCYGQRAVYNWSRGIAQDRTEARYYAAAATRVGLDEPGCFTTIAAARTLVADRNGAEALLDRALRLDAQAPVTHLRSGWLANCVDQAARGVRHFRTAIRLAPLASWSFNARAGLGVAHFIRGEHAQAVRAMEQALALSPRATWIQRYIVPAYMGAGQRAKAEDGVRVLVKDYPGLTVASVCEAMVFSPPVMARIAEGLRGAGLPRI